MVEPPQETWKHITDREWTLIHNIARNVAFRWRGIEEDDLVGEMSVHVMRNYKYFANYREANDKGRGAWSHSLYQVANQWAKEQYGKAHGLVDGVPEHVLGFGQDKIKDMLPYMFSVDVSDVPREVLAQDWAIRQESVRDRSMLTRAWSDHEEVTLLVFMLRTAYEQLSERDQQLLYLRYGKDLKHREVGEELGMNAVAVSKAVRRATQRLHEKMAML